MLNYKAMAIHNVYVYVTDACNSKKKVEIISILHLSYVWIYNLFLEQEETTTWPSHSTLSTPYTTKTSVLPNVSFGNGQLGYVCSVFNVIFMSQTNIRQQILGLFAEQILNTF